MNSRSFLKLSSAMFALLVPACPALACEASVSTTPTVVTIQPTPDFSNATTHDVFTVLVRNTDSQACEFDLQVSADPAFSTAGFPAFRLVGPGGSILYDAGLPAPNAQTGFALPLRLEPGDERRLTYDVAIDNDWALDAGAYQQRLVFRIVDRASGVATDETELALDVAIAPTSRLDFVGNAKRLDFGTIRLDRPTASPPFGVRVYSNSGYDLELVSENAGALLHSNGSARLAYRMNVNGQELSLNAGSDRLSSAVRAAELGDTYAVSVTLLPDVNQRAGDYEDRVTVTVTPL